jgi:hypothetical protein
MPAEIVQLHDSPSYADIPNMMRRVADQIESGEYGDVKTAFLLMPRRDDYPALFGWGDIDGKNDPIIQLDLAKTWLLTRITSRT